MYSNQKTPSDTIAALGLVNPDNVIPDLEQAVEVAELQSIINPTDNGKERVRDLMFLLNFFRFRRLGG
jgi:hypothetical protein